MKRVLFVVLIILTGCIPWTQVGGLYNADPDNFSVTLPDGWMKWNSDEHLLITHDGVLLQNVKIKRVNIAKDLEHTKKKITKNMLPFEVAQVVLDDISSDPSIMNFEIIENVPVKINSLPGFKATFTYKKKDGPKMKSVYYGLLVDEWFYGLRYTAALRYYFDKDIQTFEGIVQSFKFRVIA